MSWVRVADAATFREGDCRVVEVGDVPIAVRRVGGRYFAIENVCPHRGGPLGEGDLDGATVTCPLHTWTFSLETGGHVRNPAVRVRVFPVRVEAGAVEVDAGSLAPPPPPPEPAKPRGFWSFGRKE